MTDHEPGWVSAFFALAKRIASREHADWYDAMSAEAHHVPPSEVGGFALGCTVAAFKVRITSASFHLMLARGLLVAGAILWAALNLRFAGRMSMAGAQELELLGYITALIFAAGAWATARLGFAITVRLAAPVIAVLLMALLGLEIADPSSANLAIHRALLLEDLWVLAMAVIVASLTPRLLASRAAPVH